MSPNKSKNAFLLPNGSVLRYAFPEDKGNQCKWFRTFYSERLMIKRNNKISLPKLGLWSSKSNQYLLAADFDNLPDGFANFANLRTYLKQNYTSGIVTTTPSGKAKVFFVIEISNEIEMNLETAIATLELIFHLDNYDLINYIDKSISAMSIAFLTPEMVQDLQKLKSLKIISVEGYSNHSNEETLKSEHIFKLYEGCMPKYFEDFTSSDSREIFLRKLIACYGLIKDKGFSLPIPKIAKECDVSAKTISLWIAELISIGCLNCINRKYIPGVRAKTYIAKNELKEFILYTTPKKERKKPPSVIRDGEWNQKLFDIAWYYHDDEEGYFEHVKRISGWNKKDRQKQAGKTIARVQEHCRRM